MSGHDEPKYATELSRLQPGRRYGLAVIYIHAQRGQAVDDIIEVFLRLMQNLDNTARRNLLAYQIQNSERADELVGQLKALLVAYQKKGSNRRRFLAMESALIRDALSLEEACDEHLAFAGKNYLPFLLKPYGSVRGQLLDCLEFAGIQSADDQSPTWHWLQRLLGKLRHMRKVEVTCAQLGVEPSDLDWLSEFWPKQVLLGEEGGQTRLNRRFLELAIIFSVRDELKSGDLFVPKGEEHDHYRLHLVSDDVLDRELEAYGETTGIETDPKLLTRQLKQDLADAIKQVDGDFPENPYSRIVNGRLSIKKSPAETPNPAIKKLDLLVKDRLAPINIVDLLVDTCRWTNLHRQFRHLSGGAGRISDLLPPVVAMTFCYGFNLGPAQTERSLRGISRKQLAHLQLHYAKDDHLDAANTTVINAFSRYQLTKFWGTGKTASADGTQWSMHEENLISTNHIRYGGYGGIGYYLVADNYIALMARFITCGAYEATYILDLLMNNVSEVQPDTVHGDTHAQNLPVFAMAFLLGIKLMPRIRQLWRVQFSRAQKQHRCKNLEPLFKDDVNWERIQTHMREMMRVAVSIKLGKLAPSDILRRLGSHSKKN